VFEPGSTSRRVALYATIGAFVGTAWGSWSLASRGADRSAIATASRAPSAPSCPAGFVRAAGFDASAIVEGTRSTRWLVRCDPVRSESAVSESLELFWSPEVLPDPRARPDALRAFVTGIAQSNRVALEPLGAVAPRTLDSAGATGSATEALSLATRGGFRLPGLVARAWALPSGGRTLLALLVAPASRAESIEARAAESVARIEGLRAHDGTANTARGFSARVTCPAGWTDATPPEGGPAPALFVGRACIEPGQGGGAELTFAEATGTIDGERGASPLFELAAAMISAVGTRVSAGRPDADAGATRVAEGFSSSEPVTVAGVQGRTARAEIDPPAAQLALRAWMIPAGDGSVYALSTSLHDRAAPTAAALDRWVEGARIARPYDQATLARTRSTRFRTNVVAPGVLTAILGALIALGRARALASERG
jgi:hypothetical protein